MNLFVGSYVDGRFGQCLICVLDMFQFCRLSHALSQVPESGFLLVHRKSRDISVLVNTGPSKWQRLQQQICYQRAQ